MDSKNNKKTKRIKIHTDLKNSEATAGIIPVETKLAVVQVYNYKCDLYTYWKKNSMQITKTYGM